MRLRELDDEVEPVAIAVHNVEQAQNVGAVHFFTQRDLADSSHRNTHIFSFNVNPLKHHDTLILVCDITSLIDDSVGS